MGNAQNIIPHQNITNTEEFQREYLYTGFTGYLFRLQHRALSPRYLLESKKILEIGPGFAPHYKYSNLKFDEYHCIDTDTSKELKNFYQNKLKENIFFSTYKGNLIPFKEEVFDRVIISHCLEHINDPEQFIFEMLRVLKPNGYISIALPCDNGFLWRLGRYIMKKTFHKKRGIIELDIDYILAKEHVNTIFQLLAILKKKFSIKHEKFLPFYFKIPDLNFFYICHISKFDCSKSN